MKVAKLLSIAVLVLGVVSCNPPAGELVGSRKSKEIRKG